MIRTFHPIGQGAFYTEKFKDFTMVYDCGSSTSLTLIQEIINATFDHKQRIDAVFISHLHADHVNWLEYLLHYCDVKHIFLPNITTTEKIQLVMYNLIQGVENQFVNNIINNPLEALSTYKLQVHIIPPIDGNEHISELTYFDIEDINHQTKLTAFSKFKSSRNTEWIFIPFNFKQSERRNIVIKELLKRDLHFETIQDFKLCWADREKRKNIIEAYRKIPGSFNSNSMTLYSGPEPNKLNYIHRSLKTNWQCARHGFFVENNTPGCLYFGDYDASGQRKWEQFFKLYQDYWDRIGIVQIPHHGSSHNYNKMINEKQPMISIISAGKSTKYRHPHRKTIREICMSGGIPLIITEDIRSMAQFQIYKLEKPEIQQPGF